MSLLPVLVRNFQYLVIKYMNSDTSTPATPDCKKETSSFPLLKVATVAITLFINYVSMQLVYPFIPFMIKDFFPQVFYFKINLYTLVRIYRIRL